MRNLSRYVKRAGKCLTVCNRLMCDSEYIRSHIFLYSASVLACPRGNYDIRNDGLRQRMIVEICRGNLQKIEYHLYIKNDFLQLSVEYRINNRKDPLHEPYLYKIYF